MSVFCDITEKYICTWWILIRIGTRDCLVSEYAMECVNWIILGYNTLDVRTGENENAIFTIFFERFESISEVR